MSAITRQLKPFLDALPSPSALPTLKFSIRSSMACVHKTIKGSYMSNRETLIAKIKEYKDQVEKSRQKKEAQHLRFNDSVQPLYSQIQSMLSEIDGVVTSTEAPDTFISDVDKPSLHIGILGRKVEFIPIEVNGVRGLRVMGLYDRDLFFRPLSSGTWEADDERSDNVIHFSAVILFERLIALVPSGPTAK